MLGKVMEYELRACGRLLLPLLGLGLGLSALMHALYLLVDLIWAGTADVLFGLFFTTGIFMAVAAGLLPFVYAVLRFYQGMFGSEATLSFTLPVKTGTHLAGRLIVGCLYSMLGLLAALAVLFLACPGVGVALGQAWGQISIPIPVAGPAGVQPLPLSAFPADVTVSSLALLVLFAAVAFGGGLLMIYASLAIGAQFARNRIAGGIVGYLVLNTARSLLTLPLIIPIFLYTGSHTSQINAFMLRLVSEDAAGTLRNFMGILWLIMGASLALNLVFAAAYYFITHRLLSRRLNLE